MKEVVIQTIEKLKPLPVIWDRFTQTDDGYYVVYGWLRRSDGDRDFLMFAIDTVLTPDDVFYTTSSAKYSEAIAQLLYGTSEDHNPCRKIEELLTTV